MTKYKLICGLLVLAYAAGIEAQQTGDLNGWGAESTFNRSYDTKSEVTFHGKISGVDVQPPAPGMSPGTTILVATSNGGAATVDLGPSWYIDHLPPLNVSDTVKVIGSKVMIDGRSVILARKVVRGNKVLYLRESNGFPMWVATRGHIDVPKSTGSTVSALGSGEASSATGPVAVANPYPPAPTIQEQQANPANEAQSQEGQTETINGTVQRVMTVPNPNTGENESILVVTTGKGTFNIDLGPEWYLEHQSMNLTPGGNVFVNGVPASPMVTLPNGGNPIVLGNSIGYGGQFMVLRNGIISAWSPWIAY